jgi:hypothetical protein
MAESGSPLAAVPIIAMHPATWPLLARRVLERSTRR